MRARLLAPVAVGLLGGALVAAREASAVAWVRSVGDEGGRADHADLIGDGPGEPLRLVLLGDSAVDGYGLTAAESLPRQLAVRVAVATGRRVEVRSIAVSGATTADVARFQVPLLRAGGRADAVLVGVGVNDVLRRTSADAVRWRTAALARALRRAAPDAALAVAICPDLSAAPGLGPVLRRVVGLRCRAVAAQQREVLSAEGVPVVELEGQGDPSMYGRDGLHPGPPAIALVADGATEALVGRRPRRAVGESSA